MSSTQKPEHADWLEGWGELWGELCTHPKTRTSYPDAESIARASLMYARVLADLPLEPLRQAVAQCLARCEWFPTPAEIRAAVEAADDLECPTAIEGWEEALRAMRSEGIYRWENPLARRVAEAVGGIYNLRMSTKPGVDRAHFVAAYNELVERERARRQIVPAARRVAAAARGLLGDGRG